MFLSKHAQLREQQRAISPIMAVLIDEYGTEWKCHHDRFVQVLSVKEAERIGTDAKALIRECKRAIKVLKRIEKKASCKSSNMQIMSNGGRIITECNSNRIRRREQ